MAGKEPTLFDAIEARDRALDQVLQHAGEDWRAAASRALSRLAGQEMTGEEIRLALSEMGVEPHHHNAWGGFVMGLIKQHRLIDTGRMTRMKTAKSHARKTTVYRVVR